MKKNSGPRKHTNHNKRWLQLQWGIATGKLMVGENSITSYRADVDLCYCLDCRVFSYYDWHEKRYFDISDEQMKNYSPAIFEKIKE